MVALLATDRRREAGCEAALRRGGSKRFSGEGSGGRSERGSSWVEHVAVIRLGSAEPRGGSRI